MENHTEGKAKISIYTGTISKDLPVFYNPVMKHNRDISILLLNSLKKENIKICLPLAGSGVRAVRFLKELKTNIKEIVINDKCPDAIKSIKKNLKQNNFENNENVKLMQTEANLCMVENSGFDYIDIDPFGSPNPFLDSAIRRLARDGILAVTATDTGALCGTYPTACRRKYWSRPSHSYLMHEVGLRILIRRVQLIGMQYDRALTPIYSYSKDHYFRVFFECKKGKTKCDKIFKSHKSIQICPSCLEFKIVNDIFNKKQCTCKKELDYAGPMWVGQLWKQKIAEKISNQFEKDPLIIKKIQDKKTIEKEDNLLKKFLSKLKEESKLENQFFYHLSMICKKYKIANPKKTQEVINSLESKGYKAYETHFTEQSIRTDALLKEILKTLKK